MLYFILHVGAELHCRFLRTNSQMDVEWVGESQATPYKSEDEAFGMLNWLRDEMGISCRIIWENPTTKEWGDL